LARREEAGETGRPFVDEPVCFCFCFGLFAVDERRYSIIPFYGGLLGVMVVVWRGCGHVAMVGCMDRLVVRMEI
jgi:hypothetical protein